MPERVLVSPTMEIMHRPQSGNFLSLVLMAHIIIIIIINIPSFVLRGCPVSQPFPGPLEPFSPHLHLGPVKILDMIWRDQRRTETKRAK